MDALSKLLKDPKQPDYQKNFCEMVKESMYANLTKKVVGGNPLIFSRKDFFSFGFVVHRDDKPAFILTYAYSDNGFELLVTLVELRQAYVGLGESTPKGQEVYAASLGCLFTFQQKDPFALKAEPS